MLQVGVAMLHMGVTIWVLKKEGTQLDGSLVNSHCRNHTLHMFIQKKLYQKICVKSFAWLQVATIMANSYKSYWYYLHCQAQLDMPRVAQKPNSFLAVFQRVLFCKYLGWALVEALYNAFRYGYMYFAFFIVILHAQHVAYDINSKAVCLKYHMAHAKAH